MPSPSKRPVVRRGLPPTVAAEARKIVTLLGKRARPEDQYAIELLATALATWRQARAKVEEQGAVVMSGGAAIPNPSLSIAAQASAQIVTLLRELGLSPAARKKLSKSEEGPADTWLDD